MEKQHFKLEDIKAGYLLVVRNTEKDELFNMTVVPSKYSELGVSCPGKEWGGLEQFDSDLINKGLRIWRIEKIYGRTNNRFLLDNSTKDRELLWERKEAKKMTLAEICDALGYDVEVVKE